MNAKNIKTIASPMPGCPAWTVAVFKAEDVPEGTEVIPAPQVVADGLTDAQLDELQLKSYSRNQSMKADTYAFGRACYRAALQAAPVQPVEDKKSIRYDFLRLDDQQYYVAFRDQFGAFRQIREKELDKTIDAAIAAKAAS